MDIVFLLTQLTKQKQPLKVLPANKEALETKSTTRSPVTSTGVPSSSTVKKTNIKASSKTSSTPSYIERKALTKTAADIRTRTNGKVSTGKTVASGQSTSTSNTSTAMTSETLKRTSTYTKSLVEEGDESRSSTRKVNVIAFSQNTKMAVAEKTVC